MSTDAPSATPAQKDETNSRLPAPVTEVPPMTDEQIREAQALEVKRAYKLVEENERQLEERKKKVFDFIKDYVHSQGFDIELGHQPVTMTLTLVPLKS